MLLSPAWSSHQARNLEGVAALSVHYRIQHYAGRDAGLERLLPLLPPTTEVVTDSGEANPFRGFLKCLENLPDTTHLCVLQDDVLPCKGFLTELELAVRDRPDDVLSLFVGGLPGRTKRDFLLALGSGIRWSPVYFREIHHVVGLVWPIPIAQEFMDWWASSPRVPGPKVQRSDDAVVGYWARTTHRLFWATVPCLVEHPDDTPSTIRTQSRFGDKGRRAIMFLDDL